MKIGFYIQWPKGSLNSRGNVLGDELYAESLCKTLRAVPDIESCELFAPNHLPRTIVDMMIYMNETPPNTAWARKHLLYMQNAYGEGSDKALYRLHERNYDGYAFISNKLLRLHRERGLHGIFLPFGVDTDVFKPALKTSKYEHDVSYVGNDIKGETRSMLYLYPGLSFHFGLYGTWNVPHRILFWKNRRYQIAFSKISRGKIPQQDVPILYSSSKINLNCTAQDCVDWDVITLRVFEVLACKGFLITDRVPIAEKELDGAVVFTDGGDDLKDKVRYYLEHPEERDAIALNGYRYVVKNATVMSRAADLLTYIKETL